MRHWLATAPIDPMDNHDDTDPDLGPGAPTEDLVVPFIGPGLGPKLIEALDRVTSDPDEAARVVQELDDIETVGAAYRAGCEAHAAGDAETATRELRRAAERGHPEAAYDLATLLLTTHSRRTGPPGTHLLEGLRWLLEAVDAGAVGPEDFDEHLQGMWRLVLDLIAEVTG